MLFEKPGEISLKLLSVQANCVAFKKIFNPLTLTYLRMTAVSGHFYTTSKSAVYVLTS